jgi:hypothetical protein
MNVSELIKILSDCAPTDKVLIMDSRTGIIDAVEGACRQRFHRQHYDGGSAFDCVSEGEIMVELYCG